MPRPHSRDPVKPLRKYQVYSTRQTAWSHTNTIKMHFTSMCEALHCEEIKEKIGMQSDDLIHDLVFQIRS